MPSKTANLFEKTKEALLALEEILSKAVLSKSFVALFQFYFMGTDYPVSTSVLTWKPKQKH